MDNSVSKKNRTRCIFCLRITIVFERFALGSSAAHQPSDLPNAETPSGTAALDRSPGLASATPEAPRRAEPKAPGPRQGPRRRGKKGVVQRRLGRSGETRRPRRRPSTARAKAPAARMRGWKAPWVQPALATFARSSGHGGPNGKPRPRSWPGPGLACQGELILQQEGSPPQIAAADLQSATESASRHEGVRIAVEAG